MILSEPSCPILAAWDMSDKADEFDDHPILIAPYEEVYATTTETEHEEQYNAHSCTHGKDAQ